MTKVLILKGLPASGKSTFAKKLVGGDIYGMGNNWKRVNKDDLRAMLDNSKWSKEREKFVLELRDYIILKALDLGQNVVVDDTNLNPKHEQDIRTLLRVSSNPRVADAKVEVHYFNTPLDVCLARNKERNRLLKAAKLPALVTDGVIHDMYKQNISGKQVTYDVLQKYKPEAPKKPVVYVPPKDAPKALIVDIDGTLAHMVSGRSAYDYKRAIEDEHDEVVREIVTRYSKDGYVIIICSGREDDCKDVTEEWLAAKDIPYDYLLMRKAGDHRKDNIIKRELFDAHIRDSFDVKFVLDDRNQVVDMWRNELGLKVLQVAEGDF